MPNLVRVLLGDTTGQVEATGNPVPADGPWRPVDGMHTLAITVAGFHGRIIVEATLAPEPTDDDWFPIRLTDDPEGALVLPEPENAATGSTGTYAFTFRGRFRWLRARMDRNNIIPPPDPADIDKYGIVQQIVVSR